MDVTMGNAGPLPDFRFYLICFSRWLKVAILAKPTWANLSTVDGRAMDPRGSSSRKQLAVRQRPRGVTQASPNPPASAQVPAPLKLPKLGEGVARRPRREGISSINLPPGDVLTYRRGFLLANLLTARDIKPPGPAPSAVGYDEARL